MTPSSLPYRKLLGLGIVALFAASSGVNLAEKPWQRLIWLHGQDARSVMEDTACPQDWLYFALRRSYSGSSIVLPADDIIPLRHLKWHAQVRPRIDGHYDVHLSSAEEQKLIAEQNIERMTYKPRACYPYGWMYDEIGRARNILFVLPGSGEPDGNATLYLLVGRQDTWLVPGKVFEQLGRQP